MQEQWLDLRTRIDHLVRDTSRGDESIERFFRRQLENWAINQGSGRVQNIKARLRNLVYQRQEGMCDECSEPLPLKGWELDRLSAAFHDEADQGYRMDNVRGVHSHCHPRGPYAAGRTPT